MQLASKNLFPNGVCAYNSIQTEKGLELVFRSQVLKNFLIKFFLSKYDIKWTDFINRLCLLLKLLSKTCFLFYAYAFDDIMKFLKFDFPENKKRFWSEIKNIFPSFTSVLF